MYKHIQFKLMIYLSYIKERLAQLIFSTT